MFSGKLLSGTSTYLEDVLHPSEVTAGVIFTEPDVDVEADADADFDAEVMLS